MVLRPQYRGQIGEQDVIDWSHEHMAAYKYPRVIEFVTELPKTGTGKVFWRKLQEDENARQAKAAR